MDSLGLSMQTLAGRLLRSAAARPAKLALADSREAITFADLAARAGRLAALVRSLTRLPRVGVLLPTSAAFGAAFFGCQMAGRAVIPLSQILKPADLRFALSDSAVDLTITSRSISGLLDGWTGQRLYVEDIDWSAATADGPLVDQAPPEAPAAVLYTAGSMAQPKGVILTQRNLLANVDSVQQIARLTPDDVYLGVLPMSHAFALLGTLIAPVSIGSTAYYLDRFIPSEIGDACQEHQVTILLAIPTMYNLILRSHDLAWAPKSSLRLCVSGGEVLPRGVAERFEDVFCRPLLNGYGMTETSPVLSINVPWANKLGSVGRAVPNVEIRIADPDGRDLGRNAEGEIVVRGPNVMAGYLNHPLCTADCYSPEGFLRTGDIGLIDDDGYLFIRGRKKEIIIISGENVAPAEIEAVLLSHPGVAEAAVIGMASDTRGELPVAFIIARRFHKLTGEELREYCRERMAGFKVPRRFILADSLPRTATGKILKRELHKLLKP